MVIEILSKAGWGGLQYALDFIEPKIAPEPSRRTEALSSRMNPGSNIRPWCLVETSSSPSQLYVASLSPSLRNAVSEGRLLWVKPPEELAPGVMQCLLESGLVEGVLARGLERFSRATPAAIWGRRWQLAAQKSGSHLLWIHEKSQVVIGFDVRLEWNERGSFEIKKGHGYFDNDRRENRLEKKSSHPTAA